MLLSLVLALHSLFSCIHVDGAAVLPGGCAPTVVKSKGSLEMLSSHLRSVNMGEEEVVIGKRVECFFFLSQ